MITDQQRELLTEKILGWKKVKIEYSNCYLSGGFSSLNGWQLHDNTHNLTPSYESFNDGCLLLTVLNNKGYKCILTFNKGFICKIYNPISCLVVEYYSYISVQDAILKTVLSLLENE